MLKVADLTTAIPGATDNFSGFGSVAIDPGIVVFEGFDSDLRKGLYSDLGGTLSKVIAEGDMLGGKTVSGVLGSRLRSSRTESPVASSSAEAEEKGDANVPRNIAPSPPVIERKK